MKLFNPVKSRFDVASFFFFVLTASNLLFFLFSSSRAYELVKTEQKTFELRPGAKLQMNTDIGNIDLNIWAQNKVFVQLRKWVNAKSESEAIKQLERLEVDFISKEDLLIINQLNRKNSSFFSNVLTKTGLKSSVSFQIDFVLKIPSYLSVSIDHNKGKIEIDSLRGLLEITQDEGELRLKTLNLDKLDLQLGNVQTKILQLTGNNNPATNMVITGKKGDFILQDSFIGKIVARMNKTNSYLIGDEILDCDLESDEGDVFVRPVKVDDCKYRTISEKGDIFLLVFEQVPCPITLETGLGMIKSVYPWEIKKHGAGYYCKLESKNLNKGRMEFITEFGDIFIENRWDDGKR